MWFTGNTPKCTVLLQHVLQLSRTITQRDIGVVAANGGEYHLLNSATSRWSPADSHFGLGNRTIFVTVKKLLLPMMT